MPVRGKKAGNKGQGSKWITKVRRLAIYARDRWRCVWCLCAVTVPGTVWRNEHAALATLDHVIHRTEGGTNATGNLVTCCMTCNRERGNLNAYDWAKSLCTTRARGRGDSPGTILYRVIRAIFRPLPGPTAHEVGRD